MQRRPSVGFALVLAALAPACERANTTAPPGSDASAAPATATDASPATPSRSGLERPENDPTITILARAALACPWTEKGFDDACAALRAWRETPALRSTDADATLLAMLEDTREPVRALAGIALAAPGRAGLRDPARARALLDLARREPNDRVARELGFAIGELDLDATHLQTEVRELVTSSSKPLLRLAVVSRTLRANPALFDVVLQLARAEREASVRRVAVKALRLAPADKKEQVQALWLELTSSPDGELADVAASSCVNTPDLCASRWDEVLTKLEARVAAFPSFLPSALGELHAQPRATAAQKARAKKLAIAIVETKSNDDIARGKALSALATMDPVAARKLAARFVGDTSLVLLQLVSAELLADAGGGAADAGPALPR
jgi:hypothetical protein